MAVLFHVVGLTLVLASTASTACTFRNNTDTVEKYYTKMGARDAAACGAACESDMKCKFATFSQPNSCWLKDTATCTPITKEGVTFIEITSRPLPPPGPPPPPSPPPTPPFPPLPPPKYVATLVEHSPTPTLSFSNAVGHGNSPCTTTFNPSWISLNPQGGGSGDTGDVGGVVVRTDGCAATDGLLSFAHCNLSTGVCGDLEPMTRMPSKSGNQDPRIIYNPNDEYFYLFAYGSGPTSDNCTGGQCTVVLSRSKTPLTNTTWEHINTYPWHRNGCCTPFKPGSSSTYCIYGEGPSPLPGLGMAYFDDIATGKFTQVNWTAGVANNHNPWMEPLGAAKEEIKLEAGTHMVQLSSGDYVHFYAAATPGWVPNGNYTAGYIVLSGNDPTKIIQRESGQWLIPTFDYETLCGGATDCKYQGERKNVIFLCSATPLPQMEKEVDRFRLFWGGGDGNVGTGIVEIKPLSV